MLTCSIISCVVASSWLASSEIGYINACTPLQVEKSSSVQYPSEFTAICWMKPVHEQPSPVHLIRDEATRQPAGNENQRICITGSEITGRRKEPYSANAAVKFELPVVFSDSLLSS